MSDRTDLPAVAQMTWYTYRNFGTVLQAYALHSAIEGLGYQVFMVNYDPTVAQGAPARDSWRKARVFRPLSVAKHAVLGDLLLSDSSREALFEDFISEMMNLTSPVRLDGSVREKEVIASFDAFVCGSDQIWSPRFYDPHYYLDFVDDPHKRIAYAPSFGCDRIEDNDLATRIAGHLANFANLSVREGSGAEIIRGLIGKEATIAIDPTLLLREEQWSELASDDGVPNEPYCLCYFLGAGHRNWAAAEGIAAELGLRTIIVPVFDRDRRRRGYPDTPIGPREFLGLLKHAACVCTDSFHGMVFATVFGTALYAFERFDPADPDSQNTRVYSFLDMIESRDLLVSHANLRRQCEFAAAQAQNARTQSLIDVGRAASMSYLMGALARATSRQLREGPK